MDKVKFQNYATGILHSAKRNVAAVSVMEYEVGDHDPKLLKLLQDCRTTTEAVRDYLETRIGAGS